MYRQPKNVEVIRVYTPDREKMVQALKLILETPVPKKDIEDVSSRRGEAVS